MAKSGKKKIVTALRLALDELTEKGAIESDADAARRMDYKSPGTLSDYANYGGASDDFIEKFETVFELDMDVYEKKLAEMQRDEPKFVSEEMRVTREFLDYLKGQNNKFLDVLSINMDVLSSNLKMVSASLNQLQEGQRIIRAFLDTGLEWEVEKAGGGDEKKRDEAWASLSKILGKNLQGSGDYQRGSRGVESKSNKET